MRAGDVFFKYPISKMTQVLKVDRSVSETLLLSEFSFILCLLTIFLNAAWDCSAWVRTYALFLEERLECFRILKYDIEAERLTKPSPVLTKVLLCLSILFTQ